MIVLGLGDGSRTSRNELTGVFMTYRALIHGDLLASRALVVMVGSALVHL